MVRVTPKSDRRLPAPHAAGLHWGAAAPTEPGWYWVLEAPNDDPRIVHIFTWDGETLIEAQCGMDVRKMRMQCWAGPIEHPVA